MTPEPTVRSGTSRKAGKLLLFDIDGTLLQTGGAGVSALKSAFSDCFADHLSGRPLPDINFSGSTDSGVLRDLCRHFSFEPPPGSVQEFFVEYLMRLRRNLEARDPDGRGRLPGVLDLMQVLVDAAPEHRINLLTGNIQAGAWIKVRHYGLAEFFGTGAFGDDHHDRNRLCPVAVQREHELSGRWFEPGEIVVIGDTPKDIACGQAHGAHTIAVATGSFSVAELEAHRPTAVVESFADAAGFLAHLDRL